MASAMLKHDCLADYYTRHCETGWMSVSVSLVLCFDICLPTEVPTPTMLSATSSSNECLQCGIARKSGKRSCCAHGGSWFKNCGDADDTKFDHTWAEGVQACKHFASSGSVKSTLQNMLRHVGVIDHPSHSRNATQKRVIIDHFADIPNADTADSKDFVGLSKSFVCICVLFIFCT